MLEVAFVLAISLHCASASPLLLRNLLLSRAANTTAHDPTAWANDPSGRGTENILYSCFNTLFLCAWTAFHPNIHFVDSTFWSLLRRLRWMFIAIVLPEAVLLSAWSQWWAAKDLRDEINRLGQQISGPTQFTTFAKRGCSECVACNPCEKLKESLDGHFDGPLEGTIRRQKHEHCECLDGFRTDDDAPNDATVEFNKHPDVHANLVDKPKAFAPWTMEQAFLAVSGGVAIDTSQFWHRPYMSLTPNGVVLLAEIGLLPRLSKQDVQDRSRADAIAKSISCLQAMWFFIQGVARVCAGLPLTLLELHTMTHIICVLAMYAIWFRKPYGVTSPMIYSEPAMANLAALLTLRCSTVSKIARWRCPIKDEISVQSVRHFHSDANDGKVFAHLDATNKAINYLRERKIHLPFRPDFKVGVGFEDKFLVNNVSNALVRGRFNNGVNKMNTLPVKIVCLVFALLYCGSHLSAWNFHFPTVVEMWMWRGACFTMLWAPFIFLHWSIVANPYIELDNPDYFDKKAWGDRSAMHKTRTVFKYGLFLLHGLLISLVTKHVFNLSRLYILVESLASFRNPANGTYSTVDWTEYIPHFS